MATINIIGQKFTRLTAVKRDGEYHWCRCDCGNEKRVRTDKLKDGRVKSCGCYKRDYIASVTKPKAPKPPRPKQSQEDKAFRKCWKAMISRCTNPKHPKWRNYGGRGIHVCAQWTAFEGFSRDMRETYAPGLTIERRDNDAGYSPENCTWATPAEQGKNRRDVLRVDWGDEKPHSLVESAAQLEVKYRAAYRAYYLLLDLYGDDFVPTLHDVSVAVMTATEMRAALLAKDDWG